MAGEDEFHDDNPPPPPPLPPVTPTKQAPHTLSTIKLPILKKDTNGQIQVLPPKTAEEILARERERKARTTLLMSMPEDHLAKFHKMTDAKDMWEAIKSIFGGNDGSKKMQKYILKQQFESFSVSNLEGLHKGFDRFQSLLSQIEIHGAGVSTEDANQKFLKSLLASWSQVSLIMRTKPGVDTLSFNDLYNKLRVFESDIKGSTASSSSTQNVAFVSSESTNSTNDVSTAYGVSTSFGYNSQKEGSSSYTDELKYSFFANQSSGPQLDHEDLEQVDEFDLEEMDLKWQVAMISMRLKKFYKKIGRRLQFDAKEPVGFDKTKVECFNCHNTGHFTRETGKREEHKALVTLDGDGVDWTGHAEDEQENFALMAQSNSGSNTKMSTRDKSGLGYGNQIHEGVLSYEKEVLESVFDSRSSDVEDNPVNDRFAKVEGMHAVPPLLTGIYCFLSLNLDIDEQSVETPDSVSKPTVVKVAGIHEEKVLEEPDSTKVEVKQEGNKESTKKRPGRRLKMKATKKSRMQKTDSDLEEEEHLKTFIKTFSEMVRMFDRLDLEELYNLVMQRFESTTPEGVDLVIWGDLRTMFDVNTEDELWQNQERWNLKSWNFYENCGVHTLTLEDGTEIYMLAERKYPLRKETLERMIF
ncbi:hypothetical protein Tco_0795547 [Tanacetum coccineum]